MLKVEHLTKRFGGIDAVSDVTFELTPETTTAIIGPNGAGKTTLFNLITGLFPPSSGKIFFKGEDLTNAPIDTRVRKGIARSFQIVSLFPGLTIREHLLIAIDSKFQKSRYSELEIKKVNDILDILGVADKKDLVVESLPISDQRRLDAGLLFALDCETLLFDEPFAGLATIQVNEFEELLTRFSHGKTILLIEHRLNIVMRVASRIIVLVKGKKIADGSPAEIRQNSLVQEAYWGEEV